MIDECARFATRTYGLLFLALFVARGMDILSTWIATPRMVLEGNPLARFLGWKWGLPLNVALCFGLAFWPFPAIVIATSSLLVAARNFQYSWLMRSMGEERYRDWHIDRLQETSITLYLFCLFGQTVLTGAVGLAVMFFSDWQREAVLPAIGAGIVAYAAAVTFYILLGTWRLRRSGCFRTAWRTRHPGAAVPAPPAPARSRLAPGLCEPEPPA